jgi:hypothetical protein
MSSGPLWLRFKVRFDVERVDAERHELELRGAFPLGLSMHEHITVRPVDGRSRLQYG